MDRERYMRRGVPNAGSAGDGAGAWAWSMGQECGAGSWGRSLMQY